MILFQVFINSIKLPAKHAMFKLNRIGMDTIIFYMFILLAIVSLPSFIDQMLNPSGLGARLNIIFSLIYFFMFYYLPLVIAVFLLLGIVAYLGKWMARGMKRKLHYSIIWKLSACTTTIPFMLYTIIAILYPVDDLFLLLAIIYTFILLIRMIQVYPKRREKG